MMIFWTEIVHMISHNHVWNGEFTEFGRFCLAEPWMKHGDSTTNNEDLSWDMNGDITLQPDL